MMILRLHKLSKGQQLPKFLKVRINFVKISYDDIPPKTQKIEASPIYLYVVI